MPDLESVDGYPEKVSFSPDKEAYLYVLRLFDGRYYVGVTDSPKRRVIQHAANPGGLAGSRWTAQYPPVAIESVLGYDSRERAMEREREVTLALARFHGPSRVRGSEWTDPDDSPPGVNDD